MTVHTDACRKAQAGHQEVAAAYTTHWPNYCRDCGGRGGNSSSENVGERNYPIFLDTFEPCHTCVEACICPRGGEHGMKEDDSDHGYSYNLLCPSCGWNDEQLDCLPHAPECYCDYLQDDEMDDAMDGPDFFAAEGRESLRRELARKNRSHRLL